MDNNQRTTQLAAAIGGAETVATVRDRDARKHRGRREAGGNLGTARAIEEWLSLLLPPDFNVPTAYARSLAKGEARDRLRNVLWALRYLQGSAEPSDKAIAERLEKWLGKHWGIKRAASLIASHPEYSGLGADLYHAWGDVQLPPRGALVETANKAAPSHADEMLVRAAVRRLAGA